MPLNFRIATLRTSLMCKEHYVFFRFSSYLCRYPPYFDFISLLDFRRPHYRWKGSFQLRKKWNSKLWVRTLTIWISTRLSITETGVGDLIPTRAIWITCIWILCSNLYWASEHSFWTMELQTMRRECVDNSSLSSVSCPSDRGLQEKSFYKRVKYDFLTCILLILTIIIFSGIIVYQNTLRRELLKDKFTVENITKLFKNTTKWRTNSFNRSLSRKFYWGKRNF